MVKNSLCDVYHIPFLVNQMEETAFLTNLSTMNMKNRNMILTLQLGGSMFQMLHISGSSVLLVAESLLKQSISVFVEEMKYKKLIIILYGIC